MEINRDIPLTNTGTVLILNLKIVMKTGWLLQEKAIKPELVEIKEKEVKNMSDANSANESAGQTYEAGTDANRQFFNKLAPTWEDAAEFAPVRDEIVVRAAIPAGSVILDAGCGRGVMVPHLLKSEPRKLFELDLSDEMIRLNRERWGKDPVIGFLCGDLLTMELPSPDAVIFFNAYPHFMDKKKLARKLSDTLPEQGLVVIAHSRGRDAINHMHKDGGACEQISVPLRAPQEEFAPYEEYFTLDDWEDSQHLYYMKLTKK